VNFAMTVYPTRACRCRLGRRASRWFQYSAWRRYRIQIRQGRSPRAPRCVESHSLVDPAAQASKSASCTRPMLLHANGRGFSKLPAEPRQWPAMSLHGSFTGLPLLAVKADVFYFHASKCRSSQFIPAVRARPITASRKRIAMTPFVLKVDCR